MNAYLTPAATKAILEHNAEHIKANNARRAQRVLERMLAKAMSQPRQPAPLPASAFVRL